ncbi:secretin and TonB N-terminal domain-containing protein [Polynucleobacter sp. MWH-Aus1W21]|uniref:secretin and TonB N-terminal domain-containing protein n=1 Tax=Polynucleobacter sp. MWH-Aus1W21 TaxID=1855880 RepID=UPI00203F0AD7|nr:secretin and TonB N-terminal domain-containing protein [Polynucleobacter sp. MWH-Aus1W21]
MSSITLQFTDIEVSELLQVLAKLGNANFLLSESIKGRISVNLSKTPWQTALHSILASRGLRLVRNGDIYWIGPHAEIQAFQKFRRDDAALPFGGDHINSPRQILIEARIVEADERFAKELGVKLGYQANGVGDQKLVGNLDLAGAGLSGFNPAAIAATLVSRNGSRILQAELSALESEGQGKILSNPRIMTGDQVKATIEQGTELPYQTSNQNGSKLQFRKANLRLEVLPKIHPDGKISMLVGINKDTVGMKTEQGYAIDTKSLSSEVTVENGGTAIIGGIFQTTEREDEVKIPLLGDIPLIGHLFRHKSKLQDKTELLVFLTPTVLDKP